MDLFLHPYRPGRTWQLWWHVGPDRQEVIQLLIKWNGVKVIIQETSQIIRPSVKTERQLDESAFDGPELPVKFYILSQVLMNLDQLTMWKDSIPEDPNVKSFLPAEFQIVMKAQIDQPVTEITQPIGLVAVQIDDCETVIQLRPNPQG